MNRLRQALDSWRHPGEFEQQRVRRRWLEGLARNEPVQQARPAFARVDIMCRCGQLRSEHQVVSAAQAVCMAAACTCIMFRAERVVVTPPEGS